MSTTDRPQGFASPYEHQTTTDTTAPGEPVTSYVCTRCLTEMDAAEHHSPASCIGAMSARLDKRDRQIDDLVRQAAEQANRAAAAEAAVFALVTACELTLMYLDVPWTDAAQAEWTRRTGDPHMPNGRGVANMMRRALGLPEVTS
jgi:hypothetical protein